MNFELKLELERPRGAAAGSQSRPASCMLRPARAMDRPLECWIPSCMLWGRRPQWPSPLPTAIHPMSTWGLGGAGLRSGAAFPLSPKPGARLRVVEASIRAASIPLDQLPQGSQLRRGERRGGVFSCERGGCDQRNSFASRRKESVTGCTYRFSDLSLPATDCTVSSTHRLTPHHVDHSGHALPHGFRPEAHCLAPAPFR